MANSDRLKKLMNGGGDAKAPSSSSALKNSDRLRNRKLYDEVGFDTFNRDLEATNVTLGNVLGGWNNPESMAKARTEIGAMNDRISKLGNYLSMTGQDASELSAISEMYSSTLSGWDNLSQVYGAFQNADAFNNARRTSELDNQYKGYTYDQIQSKLKNTDPNSDEYEYLKGYSNYTDINDLKKAISNAKKSNNVSSTKSAKSTGFDVDKFTSSVDEAIERNSGTKYQDNAEYIKRLETQYNKIALDHKSDLYNYLDSEKDFAQKSQYDASKKNAKGSAVYEYINNVDGSRDKIKKTYDSIGGIGAGASRVSPFEQKGYDELNANEIARYNYLYNSGKYDEAQAFLDDIEVMLTKRRADRESGKWEDTADSGVLPSIGMSLASIPANMIGGLSGGIEAYLDMMNHKESNPYSYYKTPSRYASESREYISENIAQDTDWELPVIGNVASFAYNTAMSMADSAAGVATMGSAYTPLMGASAYLTKARELKEQGADEATIQNVALASGAFEAIFEYVSADKLVKIKNVDSISRAVKEALKQSGVEASEEICTELANIIYDANRGSDSDISKMAKELRELGYSDKEINTRIAMNLGSQVLASGIGGFFSGLGMGAGKSIMDYSANTKSGSNIRANEAIQNMYDVATMDKDSSAYKYVQELEKSGVTNENITNTQLGAMAQYRNQDSYETLSSRDSSVDKKIDALKADSVVRSITESQEEKTKKLNEYAENLPEDERSLFLDNYDKKYSVDDYADSYELVHYYGENGRSVNAALQNSGVLTAEQVKNIYNSATMMESKRIRDYVAKEADAQANKLSYKPTIDDSIIDYESTSSDPNKVNWNSLTSQQRSAITLGSNFAKVIGANVKWIATHVDENGKRVYDTEKGPLSINGMYDRATNTIYLDVYAGINENVGKLNDSIISTMSHETTHWLKVNAPSAYRAIQEYVLDTFSEGYSYEGMIAIEKNRILRRDGEGSYKTDAQLEEEAIDEIVARACEDALSNSQRARELLSSMTESEQKSFKEKVKDVFKNIIDFINKMLSRYKSDSAEAKIMSEQKSRIEQLAKIWDSAIDEAIDNSKNGYIASLESITGQKFTDGVSKDKNNIIGKHTLQLSERTYANGGRSFLINWLSEQGITDAEASDIVVQTDRIASLMKDIREGNDLPDYSNWAGMEAVKDEDGNIVGVIVSNGDYKMNIDFSQVCKKRVALDAVLNEMVNSGLLNVFTLSETDVSSINAIIKEHDFEIACALCFVDSKRYRVGSWADSFCEGTDEKYGFNEMVRSLVPKNSGINVDEFNFTGRDIKNPTKNLLSDYKGELDFTLIDKIMKENNKKSAQYKIAKAIKENPSIRKTLNSAEIISSIGLDNMRLENKALYKLVNSHQGTAKPKFSHSAVPYTNDILRATNFTAEAAKMVGGVRCQSFSDFMANMVFDYAQFISELSAKNLTAHSYTKEPLFVKLFGMTGMKINMSLVPKAVEMTTEQQAHFALYKKGEPKTKDYPDRKSYNDAKAEYNALKEEYSKLAENAGLDENGNYIWEDETFPYDIAMEIESDPRYSRNCGTIAVGISNKHIEKLLADPHISMVIPYHKSGLNHDVAIMRNIDLYNDYTNVQNTRQASGSKLAKRMKDFNFYEDLYKTHDAKKTADNYLKFCEKKGWIPKFDEFKDNPNYYKLLVDFRVYDIDGTYTEQEAVKPVYPSNEEFKDLILNGVKDKNGKVYGGLRQQQDVSKRLARESKEIVKEARERIEDRYGSDVFTRNSDRNSYAPTFYSNMARVIDGIKTEKIGAGSVVSYLKGKGVKDEEIKWSGIETFLDGKKSLTKAELQEFAKGSMLQIEEKTLSQSAIEEFIDKARNYGISSIEDYVLNWDNSANPLYARDTIDEYFVEGDITQEQHDELIELMEKAGKESATRWYEYATDGATNYREILFKLPGSDYSNNAMNMHWGEKGVLAHARIDDHTTTDGNRMLFVEEIQSDWHNALQKSPTIANTHIIKTNAASGKPLYYLISNKNLSEITRVTSLEIESKNIEQNTEAIHQYAVSKANTPDAPFKDGKYIEYVMKRLIRMAAEEGYDLIGWTTGAMQEDRWSDEFAEGYRIEYDQDIPKFMNKYGKKWGESVRHATLEESGDDVWAFDIPESMKNSVLHEGQTLYSDRDQHINDVYSNRLTYKQYIRSLPNFVVPEKSEYAILSSKVEENNYNKNRSNRVLDFAYTNNYIYFYNTLSKQNNTFKVIFRVNIENTLDEVERMLYEYDVIRDKKGFDDLLKEIGDKYRNNLGDYKLDEIGRTIERVDSLLARNFLGDLFDEYSESRRNDNAKSSTNFSIYSDRNTLKLSERNISKADYEKLKKENKSLEHKIDTLHKSMENYKERIEKNRKIKSITDRALTLNTWLVKNSKDYHIPEALKAPVAYFLNAIDFSSKQMLNHNIPTKKDISFSKALEQVHRMVVDINNSYISDDAQNNIIGMYVDLPQGFVDLVANLSASVNDILREVGDNQYILNTMSLEQLDDLDQIVKVLKKSVTTMNKFFTVAHSLGVADMANSTINYLDTLGDIHVNKDKSIMTKVDKQINWNQASPFYAFRRFGENGEKVFKALQDGWDKLAFNVRDIKDYVMNLVEDGEIKEWSNHINEYSVVIPVPEEEANKPDYVPKYKNVKLTDAQVMSLYCLSKREQAKGHIFGGGVRPTDIEIDGKKTKIVQADGFLLSNTELENIIASLSERQKYVADKLQEFMNTTCADWGNDVSMLRFGYKAFGEENYFPIKSDANNLASDDAKEQQNSLFRLLNMSFTKSLVQNANNRIVLDNIFDVFSGHASDMAKYNAMALPILDAFKWYNFKQKNKVGDTQFTTKSLKGSLEKAFGNESKSYITTFLRDLNGEHSAGRDALSDGFTSMAKVASVGFNARVVALQPTSYFRASAVIDPQYLAKAFTKKANSELAEKYCGMAYWKSLGFYDINIQRGVKDIIFDRQTKVDKIVEASMKGAELADRLTWGYLWNACEAEVIDKQKNLPVGSEEFNKAVASRLREVIYQTQVVDSTMTRSQMMRSKDGKDKLLTAFMSEPTLAFNMLQDVYYDYMLSMRKAMVTGLTKEEAKKKAFAKTGKKIARVITAYTITNMVAAVVESAFDWLRDTKSEDMTASKAMSIYWNNFYNDMSLIQKIPGLKEIASFFQGYSSSRMDTQWASYAVYAFNDLKKIFEGKGNVYKTTSDFVKAFSYMTGLPFYNILRDTNALSDKVLGMSIEEIFNGTVGEQYPSTKVR